MSHTWNLRPRPDLSKHLKDLYQWDCESLEELMEKFGHPAPDGLDKTALVQTLANLQIGNVPAGRRPKKRTTRLRDDGATRRAKGVQRRQPSINLEQGMQEWADIDAVFNIDRHPVGLVNDWPARQCCDEPAVAKTNRGCLLCKQHFEAFTDHSCQEAGGSWVPGMICAGCADCDCAFICDPEEIQQIAEDGLRAKVEPSLSVGCA